MKKFTIALLGVIFVTLIAGSIQSISADHLEPGQGIFKEESDVELVTTHGSNYQIYLQTVFRNGNGQLINVSETIEIGMYIPHKITDDVFDTLMGKKEIITADNTRYEKIQFSDSYEQTGLSELRSHWVVEVCGGENQANYGFECAKIFQGKTSTVYQEVGDITTSYWTILRVLG